MEALVMMLKNTNENTYNTYHPIMYIESPFAGSLDDNSKQNIIRYKSKGHRTNGFVKRQDAVDSIQHEIEDKLTDMGYNVHIELESDIEWDGIGIPADVQIRHRNYKIEELTDQQKKKVDKIIKLLTELKSEHVNACVASTPQNKLIFYKCDKWLDSMEDIQDMHNHTDFVYEGKNQKQCLIDAVGY